MSRPIAIELARCVKLLAYGVNEVRTTIEIAHEAEPSNPYAVADDRLRRAVVQLDLAHETLRREAMKSGGDRTG